MKVYWFYYKQIFLMNLGVSFVLSILPLEFSTALTAADIPVVSIDSTLERLKSFPVVFGFIGYFLAVLADSLFYKKTKFLYYNLGYSKNKVIVGTFLINLVFSFILYVLLWRIS